MKTFYILNFLSFFEIIYSQYLLSVDSFFQMKETIMELKGETANNFGIVFGIWSKYNPLNKISQGGIVGLMDSNCFHYLNFKRESSGYLELIYYDCLYPESQKIERIITYNTADGLQHVHKVNIDLLEYENVWYLFELLYLTSANKLELIVVKEDQFLLHQLLDVNLIKTENLILTVGSSLIVQNSNIESIEVGSKFSYFPGQMKLLKVGQEIVTNLDPQILGKGFYVLFFDSISQYYCKQNTQKQLLDQDIASLDTMTFTSQNININSFIFSGWYKIKEIHQIDDEFTYQFLRIMPNFENDQFSNPNLTPFQLFYKISSNNYKVIITTYSYKFPSVTLDFANNANTFMITKEFEILHKITLWHYLLVKLVDDQIFISLKFYDSYELYQYTAEFNVKQFHNVQFKLLQGNLQKSSFNYLDIQTRNQFFYNCQQQIEQQNCHYTCKDCDGPTKTDCLSCSEESSRIYLQEYKACICPYDYYDDQINQNCKSYTDLQLKINQIPIENGCKFGYFEFDDSCYACPSIISNYQITCIECLKNVQGWKQNPYCQTTVYINPNGNTAKTISDEDYFYYVFDGLESSMCRYCNQQSLSKIDSIYQDFNLLIQRFKSFCQLSKNEGIFDFNICYECKILGCITCSIGMTEIKCIQCKLPMKLINGICTNEYQVQKANSCIPSYYRNSIGECKLCNLKNCKYCFEYNKNDLSKCTLYANFDKFDLDEYLAIGCALCEDNFIFDFSIGECIYKQPSLSNCIRSYINQQNQEICTLSSTDFSLAPEIINCNKIIQNCLQCLFTPQSSIRCIICQSGFTSSLNLGGCYPNSLVDAKVVIEGDIQIVDGWVQRIQSFMMQFLPNQYFYSRPNNDQTIIQFQVECRDGYKLNYQQDCKKYCTSDCLKCDLSINSDIFNCIKCPQNYYQQPIRSEADGQCIECPELCEVCERRSEAETYKLNPNFKINEINRKYTNKCIKKVSNPNVNIDPYFLIAKYCQASNCNQEFILELSLKDSILDNYIDSNVDIQYYNQIGINILSIQIDQKNDDDSYNNLMLTTQLKQEIFSLRYLKLIMNFYENNLKTFFVSGFDLIEINDAYFQFQNQDHFVFENKNQQVNFILKNIVIQQNSISNVNSIFSSDIFGNITLKNILIIDSNLNNSSLFNFKQKLILGTIIIQKMTLRQCNFTNSQLFLFFNNQIKIQIEQLVIESCQFVNSSFITFYTNLFYDGQFEVDGITFNSNHLYQSYFLNSTDNFQLSIINLIFSQNWIEMSTIIKFSSNIILLKTELIQNNFIDSYFMAAVEIDIQKKINFQIENYQVNKNDFTNSILFNIESIQKNNNLNVQLRSFKIQQNERGINQKQLINLFNIHCFQLDIEKIQIINTNNLRIFYLFEISKLFASNIYYENLEINYKVSSNLYCTEYSYVQNQLFFINGFNIIILQNIKVNSQFSIDQSLIEISSNRDSLTNQNNILQLIDLQFIGNLLLKQFKSSFSSLITIYSQKASHIKLQNIVCQRNFLHFYGDESQENQTSLIQIITIAGQIDINNFDCQYNAITNSSNSFIYLKSDIIRLTNYSVSKHNVLPFELWKLYYDFTIDMAGYDQEQINLIIQQTFKIKTKCGGGQITASSFSCFNCSFEDIIGLKSSVFEIKTQEEGQIQFINLTIKSLEYDLSQLIDSTGCITIYSSNSLLNLQIIHAVFQNIFNRMAPSIFTIVPSLQKNEVNIQDIQIINTISLKNPIIQLQFSSQNINQNKVIIKNMKIEQYEDIWIKYFQKTELISESEIQDIGDTYNALIHLQNCKVVMQNILIQGLFACPLIKLNDVSYLLISYFQAIDIQIFYAFSLFELKQDLQIKQTSFFEYLYVQGVITYELYDYNIFYNPKINYMISGCGQVENMLEDPLIYSFSDIITLIYMYFLLQVKAIINIQITSNQTVDYLQNIFIYKNDCLSCNNGVLFLKMHNTSKIIIRDLMCSDNQIAVYGCIKILSDINSNSDVLIWNSNFFFNNGQYSTAINSANASLWITQSKILYNYCQLGGGLFLEMNNKTLLIKESIITNNIAREGGGGIYFSDGFNINQENLIQSFLQFNIAQFQQNNLVEFPTHLSLVINSQEMKSEELKINNITLRSLLLQPYKIIEQGVNKMSSYLMIPSDQTIQDYKIFIPSQQISYNIFDDIKIALKNSRNELIFNSKNLECQVSQLTSGLNQDLQLYKFQIITTLRASDQQNSFDLSFLSFHYDPYQDENQNLYILINCSSYYSTKQLYYLIKARSYKCQLGEFYADEGCQICESIYGFYSVSYNATKCSIFDKIKFANITSNSIQLFEGYWRPNLYSDYIDFCFKNVKFCKGGWMVGNELCSMGHIGGLCEECDTHNIKGEGQFFKNQQNGECFGCSTNTITPFILTSLWAIITILITLRSIEKSNQLFFSCKLNFKPAIGKILFKLGQDMESIFIKMVLNYLWIFSVIFTFNINFSITLSFIEPTSNASQFMAFSLDCFLSNAYENELIYVRIIATFLLILIQFIIIQLGYNMYTLFIKGRFQSSIISNTLLYLYVSNYSGLIKQFCSIVSKRIISNIQYVQGDLSLIYGSQNHYQWIYLFAIPGLTIFGFLIPIIFFFLLLIKKTKLVVIRFRRHTCYLFNEYNEKSYFWEQIKFLKKTSIILIMTFFESNILFKASLLGLCLLVYQLLAGKQQPYILSSLNNLDLYTGQICSIAIFIATAKYVSEQETKNTSSQIMQVVIILLFIKLCSLFIFDIFKGYAKKYKVQLFTLVYNILYIIKPNGNYAKSLNNVLIQLKRKEIRLKSNYLILRTASKEQRKQQKCNCQGTRNQTLPSLSRYKQYDSASNKFLLTIEQ